MQSPSATVLRSVRRTPRHVPARFAPVSSSRVQWDARRSAGFASGSDWVRKLRSRIEPKISERKDTQQVTVKQDAPSLFEQKARQTSEKRAKGKIIAHLPSGQKHHTEHKYSTARFKISHRKLNMLGRQIAGKPIDYAIMQMHFSEKRASKRIETMLTTAKSHAVKLKGMPADKLVVSEAWVNKGPGSLKRVEIKGRGRMGIRVHPDSKMCIVLRPGKTREEQLLKERERKLRRIVSAGLVREDVPLRNPKNQWAW